MTRIMPSRPPVQKPAKAKRNPAHMARVAQLPCCICEAYGMAQLSPTQVHHVIHDRHGTKRAPDTATIPLCERLTGHFKAGPSPRSPAMAGHLRRGSRMAGPPATFWHIAVTDGQQQIYPMRPQWPIPRRALTRSRRG